jgi:uncharacterized protein
MRVRISWGTSIKLAIVALVAGAAFWWLPGCVTAPSRHAIGAAPADLGAEDITVISPPGNRLRGWLVVPPEGPPRGVVVLLHGVHDDRRSMVRRARFLRGNGWASVLVDLSAHGESEGDSINYGRREAGDARATVNFAREKFPGIPVAGIGFSLGGAAFTLALPDLQVDGLLLEAVYPDGETALRNRLRVWTGGPGVVLTTPISKIMRWRLGYGANELQPIDTIGKAKFPLLLVSGERDARTTPADTKSLHAAAVSGSEIWLVPNAGHVNLYDAAQAEYEARLLAFLERVVAASKDREAAFPVGALKLVLATRAGDREVHDRLGERAHV